MLQTQLAVEILATKLTISTRPHAARMWSCQNVPPLNQTQGFAMTDRCTMLTMQNPRVLILRAPQQTYVATALFVVFPLIFVL